MATLSISLVTDYLPEQINNVDILIADRRDISQTQFRIMTDFPNSLNLRDGVVLTKFGKLEQGQDYNFTLRMFLNEAPYCVHKNVIARVSDPDTIASVVISAS